MTILNFEQFFLESMANLGDTNFDIIIKALIVVFFIFWLVVVSWVWTDISERTKKSVLGIIFRVFATLLVLFIPILGLIIYFIIRPPSTIEEAKWADLERRYLIYETSELGDCPNCKSQLQPGFVYCPVCGYQIKEQCVGCKEYFKKEWKMCPYCGTEKPEKAYESELQAHSTISVKEVVVQEIKDSLPKEPSIPVVENTPVVPELSDVSESIIPEVKKEEEIDSESLENSSVKEMISETVIDSVKEEESKRKAEKKKINLKIDFNGVVISAKSIINSIAFQIDKMLPKKKTGEKEIPEQTDKSSKDEKKKEMVNEKQKNQKSKKKHKKHKK